MLLPTGVAIGQRRSGEKIAVSVGWRADQGRQLRCCLAALFAALLAIAPFARPTSPVDLTAVPAASVESIVAHDHEAAGREPAAQPRPAQPATLGILSRLSLLETALGQPPVKSPLLRPRAAYKPPPAPQSTVRFAGDVTDVFHRSSVGTARTPTGPPS
ncbi:MAG TPA: hypothetical protein VE592_01685 [Geminicoccaceae bacterium]|nr:hypothetical protein [Geminicoccaceae bacterium]